MVNVSRTRPLTFLQALCVECTYVLCYLQQGNTIKNNKVAVNCNAIVVIVRVHILLALCTVLR